MSKYAPATIHGRRFIGAFPTMGACMAACGLGAVGGPLAPLAGPLLFSQAGAAAERCRRGRRDFRDWRGRSRVFALVDLSRRRGGGGQYSAVGAASTLAVNAFAFHYAHMTTILSNCKDVTKRIPYTLMNSVKKIALVGPVWSWQ